MLSLRIVMKDKQAIMCLICMHTFKPKKEVLNSLDARFKAYLIYHYLFRIGYVCRIRNEIIAPFLVIEKNKLVRDLIS